MEIANVRRLIDSSCEKKWSHTLFDVARSLGFDAVLYAVLPSRQARVESWFLHTNSEEWHEDYHSHKLHYINRTVRYCMTSALPLIWEAKRFDNSKQAHVDEGQSHFGMRSCVTLPIHGYNSEVGFINFATKKVQAERLNDRLMHFIADLSLVRDYAFESSLKYIHARTPAQNVPHVSKRELDVLRWLMDGKSSREIARITHRAEVTINFHVANIRRKLGVKTRQQALVKAIGLGIITPEYPNS